MVRVCAHYNGTSILIDEFETEEKAKEFMKNDYILVYSDELENQYEDEIIYSDEMYIDESDDVPFSEPLTLEEYVDMPF